MNDRELLELAAKAAGYDIESLVSDGPCDGAWAYKTGSVPDFYGELPIFKWSPLTDDGDALRLAVKLQIDIAFFGSGSCRIVRTWISGLVTRVEAVTCPHESTRRAIVSAAAELGKAMSREAGHAVSKG